MTIQDLELYLRQFKGMSKEYKFLPDRKFKFDFAFPEKKTAIEYEGGIFTKGRHTRGAGYANDCEKYNLAQINGWLVIRATCITKLADLELHIIKAFMLQEGREKAN